MKTYIDFAGKTCTVYELDGRTLTEIAHGKIDILPELHIYPVKAGGGECVEYDHTNTDGVFVTRTATMFEAKRVGFDFTVKFEYGALAYSFNPGAEITGDEDERLLRKHFESLGYIFETYFGYDGKKRCRYYKAVA